MKSYLKKFLAIPFLPVVFLVFLHPTSLAAMDPKVAREATEKIVSGVKNSLVIGERTGSSRESEVIAKNSEESRRNEEASLPISSSTSVRISRGEVMPTTVTTTVIKNTSVRKAEDIFGFSERKSLPSKTTTLMAIERGVRGSISAGEESSVSTAIEGEKDVEEGLKNNEKCSDKIPAERYGMDQSLESDVLLAQENIARLTDQIEEAKHEYKEERNVYFHLWDHIATKLEQSRESWNKVNELIALGNVERASFWRKAAEESEVSAERLRKVDQAYASSQKETAEQLEKEAWRDYYLSDVSTWLLKSEEAREKADSIHDKDRDLWKNLAEQYQAAADYKRSASEAAIEEKKDKRDNYSLIGDSMYAIANRKLKAFEAKKIGKETLAMEYEHTVGILQKALEYLKQSLVAYSAGKDMEGFGWYNVGKSLKPQADYRIKACEAEDVGKSVLAAGYREAITTSEIAANQAKIAAEAYADGQRYENAYDGDFYTTQKYLQKYGESLSWGDAAHSFQDKADYQARVCEAEESKRLTLAAGYREVVATLQRSADLCELSAKASIQCKENISDSWRDAGKMLRYQAEYQAKAYEVEEVNKLLLASDYRELAAISKQAAELYELSAKAYIEGRKKGAPYFQQSSGDSWLFAGWSLRDKMFNQQKAMEAQKAGKTILAARYREAAVIAECAADQFKKAAELKTGGKESEGKSWNCIGESLRLQGLYYIKEIEAQQSEQEITAAIYREAKDILKKATNYCQQAACSFALGKEAEGTSWLNIWKFLESKIEEQVKIAEKKESEQRAIQKGNNKEIALEEIQVSESISPEPLIKRQKVDNSAKSKALFICCEKWLAEIRPSIGLEPILSNYMIDILKRCGNHQLIKIFEKYWTHVEQAYALGDDPLALGWIQVAEDIQQAIEGSINKFKISREEKRELFYAWGDAIHAMQKLAECRAHYIQEEELSQAPEILSVQKKMLEGLQAVADYYRKAAEACYLKKEQEYQCFNRAICSMKNSVKKSEEAVTAFEKSHATSTQPEVAALLKKIAEQYQIFAEFDAMAAEEELQGHTEEANRLKEEAKRSEETAKTIKNEVKSSANKTESSEEESLKVSFL